jgi:hypothetical protein
VTPARLFHYQRFVEAHLVSLLSAGRLKLSRPDSFNDPWDCRVHYKLPTEPKERKRALEYLAKMHRMHYPSISEARRALILYNFVSNPSELEAAFVQMEKDMYAALCKQYRIYCLTERPHSPLMWGHYAASHTGICLELDAGCGPFRASEKVQYRTTFPACDLPTISYEPLITKSMDWSYEAEWRLIAEERASAISSITIKTNDDFLTLPAGVLKSVIIGALADETSRRRIEYLVKTNATDVLVRQAMLAPDRYGLNINPPFQD